MQPQIITNKPGQARPISAGSPSPAGRSVGHGGEAGCQPLPGERGGKGPYRRQHSHSSSNRSHGDKVSFHIKQRNGINPPVPLKSWQEKAQSGDSPLRQPCWSSSPGTKASGWGTPSLAAAMPHWVPGGRSGRPAPTTHQHATGEAPGSGLPGSGLPGPSAAAPSPVEEASVSESRETRRSNSLRHRAAAGAFTSELFLQGAHKGPHASQITHPTRQKNVPRSQQW